MLIWIINRQGEQIGLENAVNSVYGVDAISNEKSTFPLLNPEKKYQKGDFILAKEEDGSGINYFGVIDSYEDNTLVANDITVLANFEFPAGKISGDSFEDHFYKLLKRYLLDDPTKDLGILEVEVRTSTKHLYQPKETPTATNLMKYLVNAFKKYNIVWQFDRFEGGKIYTYIEAVKESFQMKDNLSEFRDWEVSTTEVGKDTENMLLIVDKAMTDVMNPKILSTWYLKDDNTVTQDKTDPNIIKPTKTKVNIYDTTATDKPTYESVANSELKGSYYSHEIKVNADIDNRMVNVRDLRVGHLANIHYEDTLYKSVLSGFSIKEGTNTIELRFGNTRSRISELLE